MSDKLIYSTFITDKISKITFLLLKGELSPYAQCHEARTTSMKKLNNSQNLYVNKSLDHDRGSKIALRHLSNIKTNR